MQYRISSSLRALCLFSVLSLCATLLVAQKTKAPANPMDALATQVEASFNTFKPTGLSIAIVKDGQVVLAKAYGIANSETKEPAKTSSLYNIASCSKAFTAAAIGLLVEEGKLRWEDKVIDYLPGFQLSDPWVTSQFTIKELLCHRSGLGTFDGDLLWYGSNYSDEQIMAHMRYLPLRQEYRTEFGYQNNLYTVAGLVIKKVTGKTWSQFISERFFLPLEMVNSCPSNDELPASAEIARGHIEGKMIPIYDYEGGKPAASIYASVDELSHWIRMWLNGGKWNGKQILDPKTIRAVQTAQTMIGVSPMGESWGMHFRCYGLGWALFDYAGKKVVEHNGGMPGYISKVCLVPESNLGFAILNNGNDGSVNDAIRFKLLDYFLAHKGEDWDKVLKGFADMGAQGQAQETAAREAARVPNTQPTLATNAYVGSYSDKTYGDAKVSAQDGGLFFAMEPSKGLLSGKMQHFHYDTWKVQFADPYLPFALISFQIGPKAEVQGLKIDLPNGDFHFWQLDFKRKS